MSQSNKFCVVCGLFVPLKKSRKVSKNFVENYEKYFLINYIPNVWYVPEVACDYCYRCIIGSNCVEPKQHPMKYVYPTIWLLRSEHSVESCYFCKTKTAGFTYQIRHQIQYYSCESIKPAIKRSVLNPTAPSEEIQPVADAFEVDSHCNFTNDENISEFVPTQSELGTSERHLITQVDFNDLIRDTNLSKRSSEILASRLQQWRLVSEDFRVTSARKRSNMQSFDKCFALDATTGITYAVNIEHLFETIGHPYVPDEWRLFIDGSVKSLKGVLLHNGNLFPSVPIIYGTDIIENYENMKVILKLINYDLHRWVICCDLKIVAIITGLKKGFSKHQCFLCLWEGRSRDLHYTDHKWPARVIYKLGHDSIDHMPLVPSSKIIIPPLHIKLGLIRNFVRALDSESTAMKYLRTIFPKLSNAKIDAGVFNGPQLNKLLKDNEFPELLSSVEKNAWSSLEEITTNFLGNNKSENYADIVRNLVQNFGEMGVNMSLKIHFLDNHLDFFPDNLGNFSDEHGERFHQEIATIENRFRGKSACHMMAEYCWTICRDTDDQHKRQSQRLHFN